MCNLRRRAAVRSTTRTNLDHTRGPDSWTFQLIPPVRAWSNWHWNTATICDRPACAGCLHTQWKCLVGLHFDAGPGDHCLDQRARQPEGYRYLASALLHDNGGMEPRVRG